MSHVLTIQITKKRKKIHLLILSSGEPFWTVHTRVFGPPPGSDVGLTECILYAQQPLKFCFPDSEENLDGTVSGKPQKSTHAVGILVKHNFQFLAE